MEKKGQDGLIHPKLRCTEIQHSGETTEGRPGEWKGEEWKEGELGASKSELNARHMLVSYNHLSYVISILIRRGKSPNT